MEDRTEKTATLYYTANFLPMYAYVDDRAWVSLSDSPRFLDEEPDIKKLKKAEFTYSYHDVFTMMEEIAAAANTKVAALKPAPVPKKKGVFARFLDLFRSKKTEPAKAAAVVPPAVLPAKVTPPAKTTAPAVKQQATAYYDKNNFSLHYVKVGNDYYKTQQPGIFNSLEKLDAKPNLAGFEHANFDITDPNNIEEIEVEATDFANKQRRLSRPAATSTSTTPLDFEEDEEKDDVTKYDAGDVTPVAEPAGTKRATDSTSGNVYSPLKDDEVAARINRAVGRITGYKLADDRKSLVRESDGRAITINEDGGMKSQLITTGSKEKVASILANDFIVMLRTYAVLYQKGKDGALPEGMINLRLNQQGLTVSQQRDHILLTEDVKKRVYAELEKNPKAYPPEFLKKFKFDGNEIRLDLKRKAVTTPDATPAAKRTATPAATTTTPIAPTVPARDPASAEPTSTSRPRGRTL